MADLRGVNLAMQTPFTRQGEVDYKRWEELIDLYVDAGVHGLVLGSGTGQHPYLSEDECNRLYERGARRIDGRCNLICQTSALVPAELIRRSRQAEDIGADALMILPPYFEGPGDDDGLFEFYAAMDREVTVDVIGYNIPQATGVSVSPNLYRRLIALDHFNYIKDSGGDMTIHQSYIRAGGNVLNGCDTTMVFALMAGAVGAIWGGANYMPYEAVRLFNLVTEGRHGDALVLWSKMVPSLINIWTGDYNAAVKAASRMRGFEGGYLRHPVRALDAGAEAVLADALAPLDT